MCTRCDLELAFQGASTVVSLWQNAAIRFPKCWCSSAVSKHQYTLPERRFLYYSCNDTRVEPCTRTHSLEPHKTRAMPFAGVSIYYSHEYHFPIGIVSNTSTYTSSTGSTSTRSTTAAVRINSTTRGSAAFYGFLAPHTAYHTRRTQRSEERPRKSRDPTLLLCLPWS